MTLSVCDPIWKVEPTVMSVPCLYDATIMKICKTVTVVIKICHRSVSEAELVNSLFPIVQPQLHLVLNSVVEILCHLCFYCGIFFFVMVVKTNIVMLDTKS